jgi:hypothetical protein
MRATKELLRNVKGTFHRRSPATFDGEASRAAFEKSHPEVQMRIKTRHPAATPRHAINRLAVATLAMILVACAPDKAFRPAANPPGSPATPVEVGIAIVPESTTIVLGGSLVLRAERVMSDGSRVPIPQGPSLTSGSLAPSFSAVAFGSDIVALNPVTGIVIGVGQGTVRTRVEFEGRIALGWITVAAPSSHGSAAMTIDHFSVIEYRYPQVPDEWSYAPQLTVSAAAGRTITVLRVVLHVPGLEDPIPTIACGARVASGTSLALNGEVYGDWTFSVSDPAHQASGADASAVVSFVDDTGAEGTLEVRGPVIRGALPTTFGGEPGGCFLGYRPG